MSYEVAFACAIGAWALIGVAAIYAAVRPPRDREDSGTDE